MKPRLTHPSLACVILASTALHLHAQEPKTGAAETRMVVPGRLEFDDSLVEKLKLPEGFQVNVFAKDLKNPRMMAVGESGTIYITVRDENKVIALRDTDGDGVADENKTLIDSIEKPHGIAVRGDFLYICNPKELYRVPFQGADETGEPELIFDDLPDGAQHPNRTMDFDKDGNLFLSVGSSCNACVEPNPEHATMLKVDLDAKTREIFATGLRNTVGFAFHPETGALWGMDHGSDHRGNDIPPEELNLIVEGKDYGWPFAFGDREPDPMISSEPEDMSLEEFIEKSEPMVLGYTAHSAPMGMIFHTAEQFPAEYRGDAYVALRGSWNREPAAGYKVVRIKFEDGKPVEFSDFMTGFLMEDGKQHFARISDVASAADGSLLVADDTNGVIYRITYRQE